MDLCMPQTNADCQHKTKFINFGFSFCFGLFDSIIIIRMYSVGV